MIEFKKFIEEFISLKTDVERHKEMLSSLTNRLGKLSDGLEINKNKIEKLEKCISQILAEMKVYENKINGAISELLNLRIRNEGEWKKILRDLSKFRIDIKREVSENENVARRLIDEKLSAFNKLISEYERKIENLDKFLNELKKEMEEWKISSSRKLSKKEFEEEINKLKEENSKMFSFLGDSIHSFKTFLEELKKEMETYKIEVKNKFASTEKRISSLESLKGRVDELESSLSELKELGNQFSAFSQSIVKKVEQMEERVNGLDIKLKDVVDFSRTLDSKIDKLEEEFYSIRKEEEEKALEVKGEMEKLAREISDVKKEMESFRDLINRMSSESSNLKEALNDLVRRLKTLESETNAVTEDLTKKLEKKAELSKVKEIFEELNSRIFSLEKLVFEVKNEIQNKELASIKKSIQEISSVVDLLRKEIEKLFESREEMNEKLRNILKMVE